jgi:hypothetical protein
MTRAVLTVLALASPGAVDQPQAPSDKVPTVAVVGCVAEQGTNWLLTAATDPVPSIANGPPSGEAVKGPTSGKNAFRLIGTSQFNLPAHKGHTVLVKGLYIKAEPVSRLNVTSVTMVAATCARVPK